MAKAKASSKKLGPRSSVKARRSTGAQNEKVSKKNSGPSKALATATHDKKSQGKAAVAADKRPKALAKKLEDTFKKHKLAKEKADAKNLYAPPKRRGRRPKMETEDGEPNEDGETQEAAPVPVENDPVAELQYEGIRVENGSEDGLMNIDKFEDYDEELNFDV